MEFALLARLCHCACYHGRKKSNRYGSAPLDCLIRILKTGRERPAGAFCWWTGMPLTHSRPPNQTQGLLALSASVRHRARNLAENGADAGGDTRHDRAGGDGHKTCHQCIFDEVLSACVLPDSEFPNQIVNPCHCFSSSLQPIQCVRC